MIIVRVELWSARDGSRRELARMLITNMGCLGAVRDYAVETLRGRSTEALNKRQIQRRGTVRGHNSEGLHVWHLVGKALAGLGYGKEAE